MPKLNDHHRADLASSGLTEETIRGSGCYSASGATTAEFLGFDPGSSLVIPYLHTEENGKPQYRRVKPDNPFTGPDGEVARYLSPRRELNPQGNRLYLPPNLPEGVLDDAGVSLIITEGEKKALAGCQEGFPTIGLAGVTCWVSKNGDGESQPIADLELINWKGRRITIVFDSDATTKPEVKREERKLAAELSRRGAEVRIARLPKPRPSEDREHGLGGKFGMDDFLKVRGRAAFEKILESARAAPKRPRANDSRVSPRTDRPEISITGEQDCELLDQARAALHRIDPHLVYRDPGLLMRFTGSELRSVTRGGLHDTLARAASWIKYTKDGATSTPVPRRLIDPLLEAPGSPIPIVRHVVRIPAFVGEDFDLVSEAGLDKDTLYVGDALDIGTIPEEPSPGDHDDARRILETWFDEFTFADTTARAHALALLITLLARSAIPSRVPMFVVEAAMNGTGKTILAEVICIAAHGSEPTSTTWTRDGEEMGKRCASLVISGRPVGFFDDIKRITGEPAHILSSLITTGALEVRTMRELSPAGGRWDGVLIATGNNVRLSEEMPRKICRIRLDSPEEPYMRHFRRPDLHSWTREHRAEIIRAVATLVNAWKAVGRPLGSQTRPSFTTWAAIVGGILSALEYTLSNAFLDPQEVRDMMTFGEGIDDLTAFLDAWAADPKLAMASCKASELVVVAEDAGALENVMGNGNERSRASRLGHYLKSQRGKVVHGHRIEGAHDPAAKAIRWKLVTTGEQSEVKA
jgi:hypothetical protein